MLLLGVCTFSGVARGRGGGRGGGGVGLGNLILYPDYLQVTGIIVTLALLCHCSTSKTIMILEPQPKNSSPIPRAGTR